MSIFRKNYYSPTQQYEAIRLRSFNEGPENKANIVSVNTSSINTTEVDPFRQGVEMSLDKHNVGMYKISAGTPGHIVNPNSFGIVNMDIVEANFNKDLDYFDPVHYVKAQVPGVDFSKIFTFPIITSDFDQSENFSLNGIIEPFAIRSVASFFSIEFPFESHSVKGSMMGGNNDPWFRSSDRILTVDLLPKKKLNDRTYLNDDVYLDSFSVITASLPIQPRGYIDLSLNTNTPFVDSQVYVKNLGMTVEKNGQDMINVFIATMTSSLGENYITPDKKSASAGFVYDNTSLGTDSIVYGGLTY